VQLPSTCKPAKISVGGDHSLVLCADGTLIGFGWNGEGQLGLGDVTDRLLPTPIPLPDLGGSRVVDVVAGPYVNSFLLLDNGKVLGCGTTEYGTLGDLRAGRKTSFTLLANAPYGISQVSAGYMHVAFLTKSGHVLIAGDNRLGQVGHMGKTEL
jgi:alpha-tubulin suppressor-like RCC1 family protein